MMVRNPLVLGRLGIMVALILSGCSRRPVAKLDLIDSFDVADVLAETEGITFGEDDSAYPLFAGFSVPEVDSDGRSFRWGTGKISVVEPFLFSRAVRYLAFTLRPFLPDKIGPQKLTIIWNDNQVGECTLGESRWEDLRVKIPSEIQKMGRNRVEFRFDKTAIPAEQLPGSSDDRTLSASFDALVIEATPEFRSGSPVPINWPRVEKRGGRGILLFPGPAQVSYRLAYPSNTSMNLVWKMQRKASSDADAAVTIVWTSETGERILYQGTAKQGLKDWVKARFRIPDSVKPVQVRIRADSGGLQIKTADLSLQKEVELTDLLVPSGSSGE